MLAWPAYKNTQGWKRLHDLVEAGQRPHMASLMFKFLEIVP